MKLLIGIMVAAAGAVGASYEARHEHLRGYCTGKLTVDEQGVAFETEKKGHSWKLAYLDIQQMRVLDDGEVRLLTYQDRRWRLGADREYGLRVSDPKFAAQVSPGLERRMQRRFVAGLAREGKPLWEIPAKHLLRFSGVEGTLVALDGGVQFRAKKPGESRDWTLADIDSISSSDPYQFTIVTYERARGHFGDRKGFQFRLKERLETSRYNELWRRLEASKGLEVLRLADERRYER